MENNPIKPIGADLLRHDLRRNQVREIIIAVIELDRPPGGLDAVADHLSRSKEPARKWLGFLLKAKFQPTRQVWECFWQMLAEPDRDLRWFLAFQLAKLLQQQREFWGVVERGMDGAEPEAQSLFLYALRRWQELPDFVVRRLKALLSHSSLALRRAALTLLCGSRRQRLASTFSDDIRGRLDDQDRGMARIARHLLESLDRS